MCLLRAGADVIDDGLHRLDGASDAALQLLDQGGEFLRGDWRARGERADLAGDDGEAATGLAGPGGLDGE